MLAKQRLELSNATASLAQECSAIATGSEAAATAATSKSDSGANVTGEDEAGVSMGSAGAQQEEQQKSTRQQRRNLLQSADDRRSSAARMAEAQERLDATKQVLFEYDLRN
jgi:hypothetical protein